MRIVHIAAEFAPIAKAGGLGEVLLGLVKEQTKRGENVDVILPKYDQIDLNTVRDLQIEIPHYQSVAHPAIAWVCRYEECQLRLLESRHPSGYFHRGKIYGFEDDIARFISFSRSAIDYLALKNEPIDILHLHDWHVSLCAPMVRNLIQKIAVKAIVLTIHNVEYQGRCAPWDLDRVGLDGNFYLKPNLMQDDDPKYAHTINLLKGGIVFADAIVAVSPDYAAEILTPQFGTTHLEPTLNKIQGKIRGILNGIDMGYWDPEKDPHLPTRYAVESAAKGKEAARLKLKLNPFKRPWIGAITRLVPQKGPELLANAIETALDLGGSFLLLGSVSDPALKEPFSQLKEKYSSNSQVLLQYEYNEPLAHQLYAALDYLLVPSLYEPCGLTQMIGMRYGAVPIVRATGGLKGTVFDWENGSVPIQRRNGFSFTDPTKECMNETLKRAFRLFKEDPASYKTIQRHGMLSDFGWKKPAQEYLRLYESLLKRTFDVSAIRINVVPDRNRGVEGGDRCCKQADLLKEF